MLRMVLYVFILLFACGNLFAQNGVTVDLAGQKVVGINAPPHKGQKKNNKKAPKKGQKDNKKQALQKIPDLTKEIVRYHVVAPGIIRGGQPKDSGFALLKKYAKVKTVVDLRNETELIKKERQLVQKRGMAFISIPMIGSQIQSPEKINQVLSIITDKKRQPVFVHCMAGKDRTGMVFAAYRMKYENWKQDKAVAEMLSYGFDRGCCINLEKSLAQWATKK